MRDLPFHALLQWLKQRPDRAAVHLLPDRVAAGDVYVAYAAKWARPLIDISLSLRRGAAVVVTEPGTALPDADAEASLCTVSSTPKAYAQLVAIAEPLARPLPHVYGITGTKGKTTTGYLLAAVLSNAGHSTGAIITGRATWPGGTCETGGTTPEPRTLHRILNAMCAATVTHVVLEASSIGLAEYRLGEVVCDGAIWTNTGWDHITYHGGRDEYVAAKERLFRDHLTPEGFAVVNAGDPTAIRATDALKPRRRTFGLGSGDTAGEIVKVTPEGTALKVNGRKLWTPLVGAHNAANVCAVVALTEQLGMALGPVSEVIAATGPIRGRLERISRGSLEVIVDDAHTTESVDAVLGTIRGLWPGRRLVTVLGAGGGTDRGKRGPMAACAAGHSDLLILTEDNSRAEPLDRILRDLIDGAAGHGNYCVRVPRSAALVDSVRQALPDGVVAVLGRGDEKCLVSGATVSMFDDAEFIRRVLGGTTGDVDQERMRRQ